MRVMSNIVFYFHLVVCAILIYSDLQPTSAYRALDHDEVHSQRPAQIPKALTTVPELTSYLGKKGLKAAPTASCNTYSSVNEIQQNYKGIVAQIVAASTIGSFKGQTYNDLSDFVDTYDRRISGSKLLEDAIDYVESYMLQIGATNVGFENVTVPAWVRGDESATLLTPRGERKLAFLGLGQSVPTPDEGIVSSVVVFNSYAQLIANLVTVKDKIVVLNYGGPAGNTLDTTNNGYPQLAKAGAKAALYRSAATFSLNSPHTRRANLYYDGVAPEIPLGYLSFEAADLCTRLAARGENITIRLVMHNTNTHGYSVSRNTFGDLTGREIPDEFVLLAAHVDSWDVAQAAQDDGAGVMLALKALELLKALNLTPRRTLRLAIWTAEEYTFLGSQSYLASRGKVEKLSVGMEADYSCLASTGLIWNGDPELGCVVNAIAQLVGSAATSGLVVQSPHVSSDMDLFSALGVPVVNLLGDNGQYFWYHHSEADTMTAVNSTELDRCLALWTSTAYILSDLSTSMPRLF